MEPNVHYLVRKNSPLIPVLNPLIRFHAILSDFSRLHHRILLQGDLFPSSFHTTAVCAFLGPSDLDDIEKAGASLWPILRYPVIRLEGFSQIIIKTSLS
jgi:hypothetical protein